ncbi:MAG: YdbL family protein [Candidatus Omnitrophica bacterium]|nr:YdbL family protein [Candidatus Omnitrophota bacterium]MCM8817465.1 YdbL family protein [Candidatus Omnitrophota bacterium]
MKSRKYLFMLGLICFLAGCAMVTIYVTFPEEKIKKAAENIEKMLESKNTNNIFYALQNFFATPVFAQDASISSEIKTDSPKIREAISQIKSWADELAEYKKAGYIGETTQYQVAIVNQPQDPELAKKVREIVQKENKQRSIILEEIFRINNVSPEQRQTFRDIFAQTKLKAVKTGEWYQNPDGSWVQKK